MHDSEGRGVLAVVHHNVRRRRAHPGWRVRRHVSSGSGSNSGSGSGSSASAGAVGAGGSESGSSQQRTSSALFKVASIVASATVLSKILGLVREMVVAGAFGVGAAVDAYGYAFVVPGFFMAILGGINGPFHSAMAASLSRRDRAVGPAIVERVSWLVGLGLFVTSAVLIGFAEQIIDLIAPGLKAAAATRAVAIAQLRILAPCTVLAGWIGIGFGALSAVDSFWLPSLSPALSSVAVILAVLVFNAIPESFVSSLGLSAVEVGGAALAIGTVLGALVQWVIQLVEQNRMGMGIHLPKIAPGKGVDFGAMGKLDEGQKKDARRGVDEVVAVLGPATVASGMMQIATYTDLYFASFIPCAAAALGYANLLVQAPVGILSSSLLVPLLPEFSRLAKSAGLAGRDGSDEPPTEADEVAWEEGRSALRAKVRQALVLTALCSLPVVITFLPLSLPIVRIVFERRAFDAAATQLVSAILACYAGGATAYLLRDVLVRVFYAMGDGTTPFRISMLGIVVNVVGDFFLVKQFGAPGLVLATVSVNVISVAAMMIALRSRLGTPTASEKEENGSSVRLVLALAFIVAACTTAAHVGHSTLRLATISLPTLLPLAPALAGLVVQCGVAGAASALAIVLYVALVVALIDIPESRWIRNQLKQRIRPSSEPSLVN